MAGKSGTQDWFYHAPKRRSPNAGPKDYPAPSQIPMLSNAIIEEDPRDETGMMRGWIRETDSKYVKLAKQRGRRDLLQIRERTPPSKDPKPYPRVDWFDHNPESEEAQDEPTVRKVYLPDYMVHEEYDQDTHEDELEGKRAPPRRPPYSLQDKLTVFKREGDSEDLKTHVKLPKIKSTGKKTLKRDKGTDEGKPKGQNRYANMPHQECREKPIMGKLLNFGYQHEWYDQREKYYEHQKKTQTNQPSWDHSAGQGNRLTTEYRDEINVGKREAKGQVSPRSKRVAMTKKAESMRQTKQQEEEDKGLFKLSKFDKVGPRINSHWSADLRLSDQEKMDTYKQQLEEMTHE